MTTLWIFAGIVALFVSFAVLAFLVRYLLNAIVLVLAIVSRVVMERKTVQKIVFWCVKRSEDRTIAGLAIVGWIIVFATVVGIAYPVYQFYSFFTTL